MTAVVLQARLDSTRLPGKSLLDLCGKPLILRVMEALNRVPALMRILACPEDCVAAFTPLVKEAGFELFAGPKDDVLERYVLAIRCFNIDRLIRATGDNPFVFADAAAALNAEATALGADYAGYSGLPLGAGVESATAAALLRAYTEAKAPHEREHVCPYLYGHGELFSLHRPLAPRRWQGDFRLTVDDASDFERAQKLCAALDRLSGEERYRGPVIIQTFRELFPLETFPPDSFPAHAEGGGTAEKRLVEKQWPEK